MTFKRTLLSIALVSSLSSLVACSDGKDGATGAQGNTGETGAQGPVGNTGAQGPSGQNGKNGTASITMSLVGRSVLNVESPEGAAEIVAYQTSKQWIYAINSSGDEASVVVIDATTMDSAALTPDSEGVITNTNLTPSITIDVSANTSGDANSIAVDNNNELLAVAMAAKDTGDAGAIAFYDISGAQPQFIKNVVVGALPDMVAFSPDGSKVVVANEGEPSGDYQVDPEGTISIITVSNGIPADTASSINFQAFNDKQAELQAKGVVFSNPTGQTIKGSLINTTVAMDLEPEYVSISKDNKTAFVSMQENNALAVVDLTNNAVQIIGLGFKDWSNLLIDVSDKDDGVNLKKYPNLYGMYQPDTIANYQWKGANFVVTANEGDAREYFFDAADEDTCNAQGGVDFDEDDGCLAYIDETRVSKLDVGAAFDNVDMSKQALGRLQVTKVLGASDGSTDGSGTYESLYAYGARSFTIWDSNGLVVFDSGDDVGRITASIHGAAFNNNEDENEGDTRSDAKGAEPEALTLGEIDGRMYAFIGLERMSGIMVYDITNPHNVSFVDYYINRGVSAGADITGDLAPEGMAFVSAEHSPTNQALLIIGNEISGSVAVWEVSPK